MGVPLSRSDSGAALTRMRRALASLLLILTLAPVAARVESGPDSLGRFVFPQRVTAEGAPRRFAVFLPAGYDSTRHWPAIVFLHGSGECGSDGERPTRVGLGPELTAHPRRWPCVVVFPQKLREDEQWEEHEALVLATLRQATREFTWTPGASPWPACRKADTARGRSARAIPSAGPVSCPSAATGPPPASRRAWRGFQCGRSTGCATTW
jgi:hypothetical protein